MKNPLVIIDQGALDIHERFAHKVQALCGVNNFWLAKIFLLLSILLFEIILLVMLDLPHLFVIGFSALYGVNILTLFINVISKEIKFGKVSMFRNSSEIIERLSRLTWILVGSLITVLTWKYFPLPLPIFLVISGVYFSDCTPLPSGKSRVRKWIDSFSQSTASNHA